MQEEKQTVFYTLTENGIVKQPYSAEAAARILEEASKLQVKIESRETACSSSDYNDASHIRDIRPNEIVVENGFFIGCLHEWVLVTGIGRRTHVGTFPYRSGDRATEVKTYMTICYR